MILIHDFKVPLNSSDKRKEKGSEELFIDGLSLLTDKFEFFSKTGEKLRYSGLPFEIKIIKKSLDLRQKEAKAVFKAIIKFKHTAYKHETGEAANDVDIPDLENALVNFLNKNGVKASSARDEYNACDKRSEGGLSDKNGVKNIKPKVLIVGTGPAGIFAAVYLLEQGIKSVLIEKGMPVENRIKDVDNLFNAGIFNKKSNTVFGEGGAGTFSDGKLTTRKNDPAVFYVLNFLVKMGAKKGILTEHKPHLGSDGLICILKNIREYLNRRGVEIHFDEEMKDMGIDKHKAMHSVITDKRSFETDFLILASGANSYDTYELLRKREVYMEKKPFAVGFRIEHKKDFIDRLFFKGNEGIEGIKLKGLYYNISSKKYGGYSFCMCPGGLVINSSPDKNLLSINGMSYSGRDMENSNSAVVTAVRPEMLDYLDGDRYSSGTGGLIFRKDLEVNAFEAGGGNYGAPFQYTLDYIRGIAAAADGVIETDYKNKKIKVNEMPKPSYLPSVKYSNLFKLLPNILNLSIAGSLIEFESRFKGFGDRSVLTGLETGTSSAVRIKRGTNLESVSVKGLYPCGEGSGYSGGIMTSAMDGIKCAAAIATKIAERY